MEATLLAETEGTEPQPQVSSFAAADCQVYWPAPYEVCGAIRDKYNELGGLNSFLLWPTSNELTNPDGIGKRSTFQNGPIYWSPWGGAHPVVNHFFASWQRSGWEAGVLGYPTTDEIPSANAGRRQEFDHGTILWHFNEAYYVSGAIRDRWNQLGAEAGSFGYPLSDEIDTPPELTAHGTRMNRFEGGIVFWGSLKPWKAICGKQLRCHPQQPVRSRKPLRQAGMHNHQAAPRPDARHGSTWQKCLSRAWGKR
jgi:uncharacterized protein with LGFP repeats